jgi:HEAT repeat protein
MQALTDSGPMVVADLASLVTDPNLSTRVAATYFLIRAQGEAGGALVTALADEDPAVRRQAVQTAGQRVERTLLSVLERMLKAENDTSVRVNLDRVVAAWTAD